ncbi:R3H and coiled-coil domain-containing protein 1-like [Myxocyprinus asiaticus]|uniref:R3H and coiled-coil domain-containing protein 1-like n=1 Tax=Myxocyprinus asiaticus TaxID=70543 RepID=UPI0022229DD2|nr:R3H and coiled-coil domain-containing protein 1-like [Myxocyprinus asiaticus]
MSRLKPATVSLCGTRSSSFNTLALPCIDGCYLPKQENEFIHTVLEELESFQQRNDQNCVLLFPPLPSRLRFLTHKTAENHPNLSTFSVGEGWARRVVVCYSNVRLDLEEYSSDTDGSSHVRTNSRGRKMEDKGNSRSLEPRSNNRRGARRPDKPIYVPRAMRQKVYENSTDLEQQNLNPSSEESGSDVVDGPLVANEKPGADGTDRSLDVEEVVQLSRSGSSPLSPDWDRTVSLVMSLTLDDQADEDCGDNTDATIQPQNSYETEKLYSEIKANLKHKDVVIKNTSNDYSCYANIWLNQEEFAHVIEIYDFPAMFKTDDLLDAFAGYSEGGMKIKWVDDTHALGIFASQSAATQALSLKHPLLKACTLSEGSQKAKWKAMRRAEFIQPVKERPRTDTVVARRMVTRALGLRGGSRGKRF